jgi:UTP---glucose-1-phosphate uridylyltransferase
MVCLFSDTSKNYGTVMSDDEDCLLIPRGSDLQESLRSVERLKKGLERFSTLKEKLSFVSSSSRVQKLLKQFPQLNQVVKGSSLRKYLLAVFLLLDQSPDLMSQILKLKDALKRISSIIDRLEKTEKFYGSIGGFLGYYVNLLQLLLAAPKAQKDRFSKPPSYNFQEESLFGWQTCHEGMNRLADVAEIYAVGGSGDRLKLHDSTTGEALPVAALQFGGRTLLEWLFRDLAAREYWYYRLFGKQLNVPVLIMTSEEKNNDHEIRLIIEQNQYFHRDKRNIFIAAQSLVPAVTISGHFAVNDSFDLVTKPGGHGVVWKLFQDKGIFDRLVKKGIKYVLVRQVNNPLAGLDHTLMSFLGTGIRLKKSFGFIGCPRRPGFAEGMLVLQKNSEDTGCIANIEYTEFDKLQKSLPGILEENCPANTNILFASIRGIQEALVQDPIPGRMVNAKTEYDVIEKGVCVRRRVARVESMMQAVSQSMFSRVGVDGRDLKTYVAQYERNKSFSVTKRAYEHRENPHETPEACMHDWFEVCRRLLEEECSIKMPPPLSLEDFLRHGPNFIGFFHPALGPLWPVIGQKIRRGTIASGSELELEIAELYMENIHLCGSLRILSLQPMGPYRANGQLKMSHHVGRAYIRNASVQNKGVQRSSLKDHLHRMVNREETCTIILEGKSEVIIEDVTIRGNFELTVPDGIQAHLIPKSHDDFEVVMRPYRAPSFEYRIAWGPTGAPRLSLKQKTPELRMQE